MEIVGLIPAGGQASRLGKIPCSKEVFPVIDKNGNVKVTSSNLIQYYRKAEIKNIFYIIRKGKWDIPEYFGDGSDFDLHIGYLLMNLPYGTPFTIDQAYPFINNSIVALGFPDILFQPEDAFIHLKNRLLESDSDIMLGVVPSRDYLTSDMLEFNESMELQDIIIKQNRPDLKYSWFIAMWRPSFTHFMHEFLLNFIGLNPDGLHIENQSRRELYVGDVIRSALIKKLKVGYLVFENGKYIDLGTPVSIYKNLL